MHNEPLVDVTQIPGTPVDLRRPQWTQDASVYSEVQEGDFVCLVCDGTVPYATGHILSIEPSGMTQHGAMSRVTVSQQFGHEAISHQDLHENSDWAGLLARAGAKNSTFVELTPKDIIALNRILGSKGFHAPEDDRIDTRLYLAAEKHNIISVLFLDLDNFAKINKRYSHSVGDQVILEALDLVRGLLPNDGLVARSYRAGDEMKVLLPNSDESLARNVAERIRGAIEENSFSNIGRGELTVTIGLATYPDTCEDMDRLFLEADEAHGRAKSKGRRNSVTSCKDLLEDTP